MFTNSKKNRFLFYFFILIYFISLNHLYSTPDHLSPNSIYDSVSGKQFEEISKKYKKISLKNLFSFLNKLFPNALVVSPDDKGRFFVRRSNLGKDAFKILTIIKMVFREKMPKTFISIFDTHWSEDTEIYNILYNAPDKFYFDITGKINEKEYPKNYLTQGEKNLIFETYLAKLKRQLDNDEDLIFHIDHHYDGKLFSTVSNSVLVFDFFKYLHATKKIYDEREQLINNIISKLKNSIKMPDHYDPDSLLSFFLLEHANNSNLFFNRDIQRLIYNVSLFNDYAVLRGDFKDQIKSKFLYFVLYGLEPINLDEFKDNKNYFWDTALNVLPRLIDYINKDFDKLISFYDQNTPLIEVFNDLLNNDEFKKVNYYKSFFKSFKKNNEDWEILEKLFYKSNTQVSTYTRLGEKIEFSEDSFKKIGNILYVFQNENTSIDNSVIYDYYVQNKDRLNFNGIYAIVNVTGNEREGYYIKFRSLFQPNGEFYSLLPFFNRMKKKYFDAGGRAMGGGIGISPLKIKKEEVAKKIWNISRKLQIEINFQFPNQNRKFIKNIVAKSWNDIFKILAQKIKVIFVDLDGVTYHPKGYLGTSAQKMMSIYSLTIDKLNSFSNKDLLSDDFNVDSVLSEILTQVRRKVYTRSKVDEERMLKNSFFEIPGSLKANKLLNTLKKLGITAYGITTRPKIIKDHTYNILKSLNLINGDNKLFEDIIFKKNDDLNPQISRKWDLLLDFWSEKKLWNHGYDFRNVVVIDNHLGNSEYISNSLPCIQFEEEVILDKSKFYKLAQDCLNKGNKSHALEYLINAFIFSKLKDIEDFKNRNKNNLSIINEALEIYYKIDFPLYNEIEFKKINVRGNIPSLIEVLRAKLVDKIERIKKENIDFIIPYELNISS